MSCSILAFRRSFIRQLPSHSWWLTSILCSVHNLVFRQFRKVIRRSTTKTRRKHSWTFAKMVKNNLNCALWFWLEHFIAHAFSTQSYVWENQLVKQLLAIGFGHCVCPTLYNSLIFFFFFIILTCRQVHTQTNQFWKASNWQIDLKMEQDEISRAISVRKWTFKKLIISHRIALKSLINHFDHIKILHFIGPTHFGDL